MALSSTFTDCSKGWNYARLYREHGWPSMFNGSAFEAAREAFEESESNRFHEEEPLRRLARAEWNWENAKKNLLEQENELHSVPVSGIYGMNYEQAKAHKESLQDRTKNIEENIQRSINVIIPQSEQELRDARLEADQVADEIKRRYNERRKKFGDYYY